MPEISVVIPVFRCGECLDALSTRLRSSLSGVTDDYEIVFVDDRSPDGAWEEIRRLAAADSRVRALRLSRNFGQHAAITAGLTAASGAWVVVMDCDLQEPPEVIPHLYAKAQEGYDIVRTTRRGRHHSALRRWASRLDRRLFLEHGADAGYSTLSMISRKVVDAFLSLHDHDREYLLVLDWLGFTGVAIEFDHAERFAGQSAYTLRRLLRVASDGFFFRTTLLLRLIVAAGFAVAGSGAVLAAYDIYEHFTRGAPPGYTSLVVLLLLLSGFIIISLGVVGLYIGRIFEQVKNRPLFVVDEQLGPPRRPPPPDEAMVAAGTRSGARASGPGAPPGWSP
jgi:glycosyltransferase involved in cell wall biosynthesis